MNNPNSFEMIGSAKQINHHDAVEAWISAKTLIFFCGSGISQFSPSDLPTGWNLLETCYKSLEKQFHKEGLLEIKLDDLARLPLETLLGIIVDDISDTRYCKSLSDIANYFQNAPPNRLHFLISSFISSRKDCHIITTNYDLGFEKALERISNSRTVKVYGIEKINEVHQNGNNCIFKIHGCALLDQPHNITFTTRQESSGLPQSFLLTLQRLFEDSLVVFCGYSLSEPDCVEALMSVSNYNTIWIDRDLSSLNSNFRAQQVLKQAREAYFLENLIPFIEFPWVDINPKLGNYDDNGFDSKSLRTPFSADHVKNIDIGAKLYENLLNVSSLEKLFRIAVTGYLQLRNFEKVHSLLSQYKMLKNYSEYYYNFWQASIIRDKNANWKLACDYFEKAANIGSITPLEKASAQLEQYGLESLLFQGDKSSLVKVENKLSSLILFAKNQLDTCPPQQKVEWSRILGRAQKNLVQNLSYQRPLTRQTLQSALSICDEAIANLLESQEIHARVETERFKARVHYRLYAATKNYNELNKALAISEKSLRLFSLLSGSMGEINARRQFALMLIESKKFTEAKREIDELKRLLLNSPDMLSQIKVIALETYLFFHTKEIIALLKSFLKLILKSRFFTESETQFKNVLNALKWYFSWIKGMAG
ncbi:MAG: SIR2 family protein [candidate division KSB1 bacterium]|nr:SIR2 family protein [candidate division KSB1 bacterium]MDZ7304741.1 SIR2 family protein [candidate division KSB1 bacterium]MDZ7313844.1 SIR2 family protein [candidate division KSB1 bacterium]